MWEALGIGGLKEGRGGGAGRWVSFWVWWGFKQASIYLGLGVALIGSRRVLEPGLSLLPCSDHSLRVHLTWAVSFPWLPGIYLGSSSRRSRRIP